MALPRYGTVEEIAGMVACLASSEAGYLTGASLMLMEDSAHNGMPSVPAPKHADGLRLRGAH